MNCEIETTKTPMETGIESKLKKTEVNSLLIYRNLISNQE